MANNVSLKKKRITIGVAATLMLAGAGVAFAYWTSTGTGDGTATTDESVAFTIATETAVGTISPGNAGQTVEFTVTNPGEGSQFLTGVTVAKADAQGVAWVPAAGCEFADYVVGIDPLDDPSGAEIPADGNVTGTVTVELTNTGINQDACQGQTVPLHIVAN